MSRFNRFFVSFGIALFMVAAIVAVVRGSGGPIDTQWGMSCVELNDLIENYRLDRSQNVGIYQAAHGANAEIACQGDHRNDVAGLFHWAFVPIEEILPTDPRYAQVSPTSLSGLHRIKLDHTEQDLDFGLIEGKYLATIHWWDKDERTDRTYFYAGIKRLPKRVRAVGVRTGKFTRIVWYEPCTI